ncbi:hypothetical protein OG474_30530 [Kribbella sp. NBC_01505]|uniref:hypothetical protein n=1 Tax=Kribbella sp. NBC_01505 TaxID=2903580 RepID=UPI0038663548
MLSMAAMQSVDDVYKILVVVLVFAGSLILAAMFRAPIGKLLVRLESLQLPFVSARFTKTQAERTPDVAKALGDVQPPTDEPA